MHWAVVSNTEHQASRIAPYSLQDMNWGVQQWCLHAGDTNTWYLLGPQGLRCPHLMLKAWGTLGELLVFSSHSKDEEAGF